MAERNAIELGGVSREYGERLVLRHVTISVRAGETLVVLGPNGAGKTTLLRILATLLRPTTGTVQVLGASLPGQAWKARGRIGYLGHRPLLYRELTVVENLNFHARLHRLEASTARAGELLEQVGMEEWAGERAQELSAGMAQRVAVCRALLHEPELLLLDEPNAHLDPEAAGRISPLLDASEGRTRVLVTHDPAAGLAQADAVLVLRRDGSVAHAGPASQLADIDPTALYRAAG